VFGYGASGWVLALGVSLFKGYGILDAALTAGGKPNNYAEIISKYKGN
jgi:hypothetical protein